MAFTEVEAPEAKNACDAWAGWDGMGLGPGQSLYVTTGARPAGGGGPSQIWRLDQGGSWANDGVAEGAEVINKIRNDTEHLYAFFESPGEGQTWIVRKSLETAEGGWEFVNAPRSDSHTVGGRGIGIDPAGEGDPHWGAAHDWDAEQTSVLYSGTGFEPVREHHSLLWELEYDSEGRLWEFWSDFSDGEEEPEEELRRVPVRRHAPREPGDVPGTPGGGEPGEGEPGEPDEGEPEEEGLLAACYVDGDEKTAPPGGDISHAAWFKGHMYVTGALAGGEGRNTISRSADGSEWEAVHTFSQAGVGDHILSVPRQVQGEGELWAVGHHPLEVVFTFDGETWEREPSIPEFETGEDTNHLTAIAYYQEGVWVFARDADAGKVRAFTDGAASIILQVI